MPIIGQIVSPTDPGSNGTNTPGSVDDGISALLNLPGLSTTPGVPTSTAPVQYNATQLALANVGSGTAGVLTNLGGTPIIASTGVLGGVSAVQTRNGVQASAGVNANSALTLVTAPGIAVSLQANAGAQASGTATIGQNGVHLTGAVGASALISTTAAYSTNLGSAGSITAGAAATTGVVAVAAGNATISSSGLTASEDEFAGSKTSVTAGSTYTGEGVEAGAGAGALAPGSVGTDVGFSVLNSNGYVGINTAVTLDLGLGGLSLNFQFGLDIADVKSDLLSGATAVLGALQQFGSSLPQTVNDPNPFIRNLFGGSYTAGQNAAADFTAAGSAITSAANTVASGVTSAVSTIETGVNQAISAVAGAFTTVEHTVVSGANTVGSFISNTFNSI